MKKGDLPLTTLVQSLADQGFAISAIIKALRAAETAAAKSRAGDLATIYTRRQRDAAYAKRKREERRQSRPTPPLTPLKSKPNTGKVQTNGHPAAAAKIASASANHSTSIACEDSRPTLEPGFSLPTTVLNLQVGSESEGEVREIPSAKARSRTAGISLPPEWQPKSSHYALAEKLGCTRDFVDHTATTMREWAMANANRQVARKAGDKGWDLTFNGFLRRDAAKGGRGFRAAPRQKTFADLARDMMDGEAR